MGGVIDSNVTTCSCGGKWVKQKLRGYDVPVCGSCGKEPPTYRVRRYLPGKYGEESRRIEIRHGKDNKKLEDIFDAISVMKEIDREIEAGTFDPQNYGSKEVVARFNFTHFVEKTYLPMCEAMVQNGEIKPSVLKNKKSLYERHLKDAFKGDMRNIGPSMILGFYRRKTATPVQNIRALQELRKILGTAVDYEILKGVPKFPKMKKSAYKDPETFFSLEQQNLAISHVKDPAYKVAIRLLAKYAMRPGEVRALREKDIDLFNDRITIAQHFSANELVPGRKSNENSHFLHMDEEAKELITPFLTGNPDGPLFKGKQGSYMAQKVLAEAWHKACEEAGLPDIDLYTGTKHSTLTMMKRAGFSDQEIMNLTGHETLAALKHYAQQTNSDRMKDQKNVLKFSKKVINE